MVAIPRPVSALDFPRFVLRLDATTVIASSVVMIAGARPIRDFLGIGSAEPLVLIGVLFLIYAGLLLISANRSSIERRALLIPALASSQSVGGLGDDARVLPRGAVSILTGTAWRRYIERYARNPPGRKDGAL